MQGHLQILHEGFSMDLACKPKLHDARFPLFLLFHLFSLERKMVRSAGAHDFAKGPLLLCEQHHGVQLAEQVSSSGYKDSARCPLLMNESASNFVEESHILVKTE